MNEQDRNFSPTWIDEQIERPTELLSREDAVLVQDLHAMYTRENAHSLDQVWMRLAQLQREEQPGSGVLPIETRRTSMKDFTSAPQWGSQLRRPLSMIAAALILTVLVGSMIFVINNVIQRKSTLVGSAVKTATPVPQVNCWPMTDATGMVELGGDEGEHAVCLRHEEIAPNVATTIEGITVTLVAAYADPNRLIIRYTAQSRRDLSGRNVPMMDSVTTADGLELPGGTSATNYNSETKQGWGMATFDTAKIALDTKELRLRAVISAAAEGNAQKAVRTSIDFTVPFHAAHRVVTTRQTISLDGTSVTLDHIIVTESATRIWLKYANLGWLNQGPDGPSLSGNGWNMLGASSDSWWTVNGPLIGFITTINVSLLDKQGVWTMTLWHGRAIGTFHFTPI